MKQQVLVIHGADAFETYEKYLNYLKTADVSLETLRKKGWKGNLQKKLGKEYDVLRPTMPNKTNARYKEWKIYFEKLIQLLDDSAILIGHSMGGLFLVKYLSENKYPKKIKGIFLIAAPHFDNSEPLVDFTLKVSLKNLQKQIKVIFLYHSLDDTVVPISHFEKYKKELPGVKIRIFDDRGHFNGEDFSELVEDVKGLKN